MADDEGSRAKRAAEPTDDAPTGRPKRYVTPDWDDWDPVSEGTPETGEADAPPPRGGRFAAGDDDEPRQPARGPGRYSWADEASAVAEDAPPVRQDSKADIADPGQPQGTRAEQHPEGTRAWHAIPVEPVPGASRAAQSAPLGEKRRREPPALPSTQPPASPSERREALVARERAARPAAPGALRDDDWTGAPLPASAVPPPSAGQAPSPIDVQQGETPVGHHAYTRPEDEPEDEDTVWLRRRPSSRAADAEPASQRTPPSGPGSGTEPTSAPEEPGQGMAAHSGATAGREPQVHVQTPRETASPVPTPPPDVTVPSARPRRLPTLLRSRPFMIGAAALLLVVVLLVGYLVVANRVKPSATASSETTTALVERLVTPAQLSGVGPGGWTEQTTESTLTPDSPTPLCYVASPDPPTPAAQAQRKLTAAGATLLHTITGYASSAEADQAYAQRLIQLGQCSNIPVYLSSGVTVTSLGDAAVGVNAVIQDTTPQYHTVVVVRTGSMILTYDVTQPGSAVPYDKVLAVAAQTVRAICSAAGGGCSASPTATVGIPPAGALPGWLTVSDLPRVTAGMGRWNATAPKSTVTSTGSACENLTFATVDGPNQRRQRTYLLTEDTKVPKDFGLDEVILDFNTPDAAAAFAGQLKSAITDCPTRTATAKLGNTADITAKGVGGQDVTGFWRTVIQSTSATTSFIFRVGVASVGTRVVYLLATPSSTFDFTDADWAAITERAGQRATQGG